MNLIKLSSDSLSEMSLMFIWKGKVDNEAKSEVVKQNKTEQNKAK